MDEKLGREAGTSEQLISYVKTVPVMICVTIDAKTSKELGWKPGYF
jgi:dTDP-glucose 4,6-dehydratase